MATDTTKSKASQDFIPIKEIRDGVLVLKDGSMRGIIMLSSLNFALKSAEEQNSILFQFQNFLNSLDFPIQISIQSRRLDIRPYIALIESKTKEQTNDLMRIQIREYMKFIRSFTGEVNIMTKTFFIVVPYTPASISSVLKKGFFGKKKDSGASKERADEIKSFEEHRTQLEKRIGLVESGITRCGLRTAMLGTEELVEVFYKLFNPGDVEKPIPVVES